MAKKKYDLQVKEGDVFAARLDDGRFGAVHVIDVMKDGMRRGRDSATLVTTRYLGSEAPHVDDPTLRQVLWQQSFFWGGRPSVMTVDVPPPGDFNAVGNFARTEEEAAIAFGGPYGGGWSIVHNVLVEWRWEHDREGLVREVEQSRAHDAARFRAVRATTLRRRTPRSQLTENQFWELVARVDTACDEGDGVEPLIVALAQRNSADIREFQEILAHKLYQLDARQFADRAGAAGRSGDAFLYSRCSVVARGQQVFEAVLTKPELFPADEDLESLLNAAPEAFLRRTGRDYEYDTHYCYETGSNADGWPEDASP